MTDEMRDAVEEFKAKVIANIDENFTYWCEEALSVQSAASSGAVSNTDIERMIISRDKILPFIVDDIKNTH
jgi:hypothetical protein